MGVSYFAFNKAKESQVPPKVEKKEEAIIPVRQFFPVIKDRSPLVFSIGTIEALDYTILSSPIEADVVKVFVREGYRFAKGQSLLAYDLRSQKYDVQAQEAGIDELRTQASSINLNEKNDTKRLQEMERLIDLAEKEFKRNQTLLEKKVVPLSTLEKVERALVQIRLEYSSLKSKIDDYATQRKRLQAQIETALVRLQQSKLIIEKADIKVPFSGRVVRVHASVGERMGRGTPLFDVFDPSKLRLRVALPQRYSELFSSKQSITAKLINGKRTMTLSLIGVNPQIEAGNSSIDTYFSLPDGNWILGSVWDVVINLPKIKAIAVSADAVYNDDYVYRIDEEDRVYEEKCQRLGVTDLSDSIGVLLDCPSLEDNTSLIADQLPSLFNGVKVSVIETVNTEAE